MSKTKKVGVDRKSKRFGASSLGIFKKASPTPICVYWGSGGEDKLKKYAVSWGAKQSASRRRNDGGLGVLMLMGQNKVKLGD